MTNRFNFTKATLEGLPSAPAGKKDAYYDTKVAGLTIMVTAAGVKTFFVYKKVNRRPERIMIGHFPDLTIEQARKQAQVILSEIAQDRNPAEERRKIRDTLTLGDLFSLYMEKHGQYKKTARNSRNLYKRYLSPWADRRLSDIRRSDVLDLHSEIGRANGHACQANRLRTLLHAMYEFAIDRGYEGMNPCRGVKKLSEGKRDRFLQEEELPRFFDTVLSDSHSIIRDFILMALYTGARSSNIQSIRWDEIDWERAVWRIPETKSGHPHTVPLVTEAIELLKERRQLIEGEWVFPGGKTAGHIGNPKVQWERICVKAGFNDLHIHDLRRTLGSWMAKTGASMIIIAGALGHRIESSSVTGVYARLDLEPIRIAMETAVRAMLRKGGIIQGEENVIGFRASN